MARIERKLKPIAQNNLMGRTFTEDELFRFSKEKLKKLRSKMHNGRIFPNMDPIVGDFPTKRHFRTYLWPQPTIELAATLIGPAFRSISNESEHLRPLLGAWVKELDDLVVQLATEALDDPGKIAPLEHALCLLTAFHSGFISDDARRVLSIFPTYILPYGSTENPNKFRGIHMNSDSDLAECCEKATQISAHA